MDESAAEKTGRTAVAAATAPFALVTWCLGTFHVAVLTIVAVLVLQRGGDLGPALAGLDTALGLGLYAFLWVLTWGTTRRGLRAAWREEQGLLWMSGVAHALAWGEARPASSFSRGCSRSYSCW